MYRCHQNSINVLHFAVAQEIQDVMGQTEALMETSTQQKEDFVAACMQVDAQVRAAVAQRDAQRCEQRIAA